LVVATIGHARLSHRQLEFFSDVLFAVARRDT
jgi:hypothetical protein